MKNVTGVVATDRSVELPAASIDLAFICDTYHHFEFPLRTMESLHRALRPGGQVVVIDFERIEGQSSDGCSATCAPAGKCSPAKS